MAQYGQTNPTDEEVQGIVARFVKPRRSEKLSDQVVAEKLLELFKEKANQQLKKFMTNLLLCLTENKF
jgi:trigger factor